MTFQKRLKACMKVKRYRVADVARWFNVPYTTAREWVVVGRQPKGAAWKAASMRLSALEFAVRQDKQTKASLKALRKSGGSCWTPLKG